MDYHSPRIKTLSNIPDEIEDVWIFGSYARSDYDSNSDLDLLVLTNRELSPIDASALQQWFTLPSIPEISLYTLIGISQIIAPPSLFAWHLRREGQVVYSRSNWLAKSLSLMGPYSKHLRDLYIIKQVHYDLLRSLENGGESLIFDAGILCTVARNVGIILSDFLGQPDYSPLAPLKLRDTFQSLRFPLSAEEFILLSECRLSAERGKTSPLITLSTVRQQAVAVEQWLQATFLFIQGAS
jgi:hypothetical protein